MIDQSAFELCASQLSATPCPDCGATHEVSLRFDDRGVMLWSVDEAARGCVGFKELVSNRLSRCTAREQNRYAEFRLRRALGDPSL